MKETLDIEQALDQNGQPVATAVEETETTNIPPEQELKELRAWKEQNITSQQAIVDLFKEYPELFRLFQLLQAGASLQEAIAEVVDVDELVPADGEPDHAKWEEAKGKRKKHIEEKQKYYEQVKSNIELSQKAFNKFIEDNSIPEERIEEYTQNINKIVDDAKDGLIDDAILSLVWKAMNSDIVVEEAKKKTAVDTANKTIEEMSAKKAKKSGDGLPHVETRLAHTSDDIRPKDDIDKVLASRASRINPFK